MTTTTLINELRLNNTSLSVKAAERLEVFLNAIKQHRKQFPEDDYACPNDVQLWNVINTTNNSIINKE